MPQLSKLKMDVAKWRDPKRIFRANKNWATSAIKSFCQLCARRKNLRDFKRPIWYMSRLCTGLPQDFERPNIFARVSKISGWSHKGYQYCSSKTTVVEQNSVLHQSKISILLCLSPEEVEQGKNASPAFTVYCFILFLFWNLIGNFFDCCW